MKFFAWPVGNCNFTVCSHEIEKEREGGREKGRKGWWEGRREREGMEFDTGPAFFYTEP